MSRLTDTEALDALCGAGVLSAEGLNMLHACRPGHPLANPFQWRNAYGATQGRGFSGATCWAALDLLRRRAEAEASR